MRMHNRRNRRNRLQNPRLVIRRLHRHKRPPACRRNRSKPLGKPSLINQPVRQNRDTFHSIALETRALQHADMLHCTHETLRERTPVAPDFERRR